MVSRTAAHWTFLGVWFALVSVPAVSFLVWHWAPLPMRGGPVSAPPEGVPVSPGWDGRWEPGRWNVIHILAEGCGCSAETSEYLARRRAMPDATESAWVVGDEHPLSRSLTPAGLRVFRIDPDRLASDFGIVGGPWLLVVGPDGRMKYSGGHSATRPRRDNDYDDLDIVAALRRGESVAPRPAFGCAVGADLQRAVDPLGLKYARPGNPLGKDVGRSPAPRR